MTSSLMYANHTMDKICEKIKGLEELKEIKPVSIEGENKYIIYLSVGNKNIRSIVLNAGSDRLNRLLDTCKKDLMELIHKRKINPEWIKVDIVTELEKLSLKELEQKIKHTRRNYFRHGIAFEPSFRLSFLEQEINGNALIRMQQNGELALDERNINHYLQLQNRDRALFIKNAYTNKPIYLFKTFSLFIDREENVIHELYRGKLTNGIRKTNDIEKEVRKLINSSTNYLTNLVEENGKFQYGYFSAFAKTINTYNILRHASSLYAMIEGYEIVQAPHILEKAELGLKYLIEEAIVYKDEEQTVAYVVDHANKGEIKLGSNATAILAMTKYMEVTKTNKYIDIARALARGIIKMKLPNEGFIHVLEYPSFKMKDLYRIIYYEGEAIFALLRLYAIDQDENWLNEVTKTFDYFIENNYWKYHDHWLSYAANELTLYTPEDKYFIFGLKNANEKLSFIHDRETTFPTFLELTMAAYKMIQKIKELKKDYLLTYIDEQLLIKTIDRRAEYQRVGFFYPELAMYKKNPNLIKDGFFIRHHAFRVRIDDVEHYLSGYCQYLLYRVPDMTNYKIRLTDI